MGGKKLTITGGDEAHYLKASRKSSRLVRFPDGLIRHITLRGWEWEVFDRIQKKRTGWPQYQIAGIAFEHALDGIMYPDDFEKQLRFSFSLAIEANMADVMKQDGEWMVANQRFWSTVRENDTCF
jgi:hypothetical protein